MIKSAIFGIKLINMHKIYVLILFISILASNNIYSQFTESINTNRPGASQGAFSVGKNVIQIETGLEYSRQRHRIFDNRTRGFEFEYLFRVGLLKEQLEFNLEGSFLNNEVSETVGNTNSFTDSGFTKHTLGAKYLIYDPYKYNKIHQVNIKSWKANRKFSFKKLIPAVSAYVGLNIKSTTNDFAVQNNSDNRATETQSGVSPKIVISAQNNWTKHLVFVSNIVYDDIATEFPDLRFILTTTYNFKDKWSVFGEYEYANSKIYKDHILRSGGTYLFNDNLQFDAGVSTNLKNTPYIFTANVGVSYRFDFRKPEDDEQILSPENKEIEDDIKQIKKDIADGLLEPDVLTGKYKGVNLEDYADEEVEEEVSFEGEEEANTIPKKKKWWQKIGQKRRLKKEAKRKANDTTSTVVTTTKVLGTGGRISDFADDEFLESKKDEISVKERTPEEQAILDAKIAERTKKKNKGKEPLIDPLTNKPFTEEELSQMSKREIKKARKEQEQQKKLDDELTSLLNEVESEQSARDIKRQKKKAAKKAAKEARKKVKTTTDTVPADKIESEPDSIIPDNIEDIDKELAKLNAEKDDKALEKHRLKQEKKAAKAAKKKAKAEAKKKAKESVIEEE